MCLPKVCNEEFAGVAAARECKTQQHRVSDGNLGLAKLQAADVHDETSSGRHRPLFVVWKLLSVLHSNANK